MKPIPNTEHALVLRTDFSNQNAWDSICAAIRRPNDAYHFIAYVDFMDDEGYSGINKEQLLTLITENYNHSFIIIIDETTISHPDHPLLIIDLIDDGTGNEFRALPAQVQAIEITCRSETWTLRSLQRPRMKMGSSTAFPGNNYLT